jgi:cobalt-zinc-cadmium efflux system outer membrane protein
LAPARADVEVARAGVRSAGALPNPVVGASLGPDEPTLVGSVEQRFPIFGQRARALDAADAEVGVAQASLAARILEVQLEVDRAYTALSAAQARAQLAYEAARIAKELADRTATKVQTQLAPELELEQANLAAGRADQDARDRQADVEAAQFTLAALLGLSPDARLQASDVLTPLPQPPTQTSTSTSTPPEVQVALKEREAAERRADHERAAIRPVPDLTLDLERLQDPTRLGVRGTVALEVPLLSQNQGAVDAEEAKRAQAEARANAATLRLDAARRAAQVKWDAARQRAEFMETRGVPSAVKVRDLARAASELGRIPFTSLLQAEADVTHAQLDAIDAEAGAWDALDDLRQAEGVAP